MEKLIVKIVTFFKNIIKLISPVTLAIKRNKILYLRAFAVAASVLLLCIFLFDIQWRIRSTQKDVNEIAERPVITTQPVVSPEPEDDTQDEPTAKPTPTPRPPKPRFPNERDINFVELSDSNPDIMGWLEIPGTKVDYPVVTTYDNEFYLDHDFFGNRDHRGTIFADIRNNMNWEDPFVVLYGHNNKDGSMFSSIRNYRNENFFNENKRIIIYTPDGQLEYKVFAAYLRDDEHLLGTRNFKNPVAMRVYLDEMQSVADEDAIIDLSYVNEKDSILALSVCYSTGDVRFIVHAVFVPPVKVRDFREPDYIE